MSTNLLANAITAHLDRTACLAILADAPEHVLRGAVAALLSGAPAEAPATPVAAPAVAKAPKVNGAAKAAPVARPVAAKGGNPAPADAIAALAPEGFAVSELAALCGVEPRDSGIKTAIKHAIAAKTLHTYGERRFLRYGATAAIAKARSEADRKGGQAG
jgi:hypothetical protein